MPDRSLREASTVKIGQVWEDTHVSTNRGRWLVRVMKLNAKSARVEPVDVTSDWYVPIGYEWQYRMEFTHFDRGRMRLVRDV